MNMQDIENIEFERLGLDDYQELAAESPIIISTPLRASPRYRKRALRRHSRKRREFAEPPQYGYSVCAIYGFYAVRFRLSH